MKFCMSEIGPLNPPAVKNKIAYVAAVARFRIKPWLKSNALINGLFIAVVGPCSARAFFISNPTGTRFAVFSMVVSSSFSSSARYPSCVDDGVALVGIATTLPSGFAARGAGANASVLSKN